MPKKRGLFAGQFADLRGGGWLGKKEGEGCFCGGVDTPMHTMVSSGWGLFLLKIIYCGKYYPLARTIAVTPFSTLLADCMFHIRE